VRNVRVVRGAASAALAVALAVPSCAASRYHQLSCRDVGRQSVFILEAQAVPSATFIPCIGPLPEGWSYAGSEVRSGFVRFWLDSDRAGSRAVEVTFTRACATSTGRPVASAGADTGVRVYEDSAAQPGTTVRHYVFDGGCATSRFSFNTQSAPSIFEEAQGLLGFTPRSIYVEGVSDDERLTLCGAGAPPCPG
jgi:hypothetical protein